MYQISHARSYTELHFSEDGKYEIMINKEEDGVIKAQVRSRHTSSNSYNLWIDHNSGINPVSSSLHELECSALVHLVLRVRMSLADH